MASLVKMFNRGTAVACQDYESQTVLKEPKGQRPLMRVAVLLIVLAFTAWAVEWIAVNSSGVHIKEMDFTSKAARADHFPPVPPGGFNLSSSSSSAAAAAAHAALKYENIICPCLGEASFSWCSFIDFFLVTSNNQETNYQLNVTMISTSNSSSCIASPSTISFACHNCSHALSCNSALGTVFDFTDTRTYIQTPNLASPFQVYHLVATNMLSNIHVSNQTMYDNLNSNSPKDYNQSILVLSLVQSMVTQVFDFNTSSTMQQFWDRANQYGWNLYPKMEAQFNGSKFAFGMTINYQAYSTMCNPQLCFIIVKDNVNTRLIRAIGEVGGVGSLILLGIRCIIWPIVARLTFGFRRQHQGTSVDTCWDFLSL